MLYGQETRVPRAMRIKLVFVRQQVDGQMIASRTTPAHLYKYASLEGEREEWARQVVERHTVYFPAPASFNDPFDSKAFADLVTPQDRLDDFETMSLNIEAGIRASAATLDRVPPPLVQRGGRGDRTRGWRLVGPEC